MPNYVLDDQLEELGLCRHSWDWNCDNCEDYKLVFKRVDERNKMQEGLVYLFREWLDLISPSDFGNDEGLSGVLV